MLKWICVLTVLWGIPALGQENIRFSHLNKTHGLSNNIVNCMVQDNDGFIWVGTHEGLNRYDGRDFKQFKLWNETAGKQGNIINNLYIDDQERLWACTADAGLFFLGKNTLQFKHYPFDTPVLNVLDLQQDQNGDYFVGFERSPALKFQFDSTHVEAQINSYFRHNLIYHFFESRERKVIAAALGAGLVELEDNQWKPVFNMNDSALMVLTISGFIQNEDFTFFGGWNDKVYIFDHDKYDTQVLHSIDPTHQNDDEIKCLSVVDNYLWIGSRRTGLHLVDLNTKKETHYPPSLWNNESISSNEINCFLKDREGRVWIGTSNGISLYDPILFQFSVDFLPGALLNNTGTNQINCIFEDKNQILVGTQDGMFSLRNRSFTHVPLTTNSLSIYSIQRDTEKRLWIGTNKSINIVREPNMQLIPMNTYYSPESHSTSRLIFDLPSSRIGNITPRTINGEDWIISSIYGYAILAINSQSLSGTKVISLVNYDEEQIYEGLVRKLYVDRRDKLWVVGFSQGLMYGPRFPKNLTKEVFPNLGQESTSTYPDSLFDISIPCNEKQIVNLPRGLKGYDLIEFENKRFYYTTYGNGLYLIEEKNNQWTAKHLDSPHKSLEGIQVDDSGCIWIITSGGFDCYRPQIDSWQRFDFRDGFPKKGISGDLYKLKDGRLMACGEGYLVSFDPLKIRVNTNQPKTIITSLSIFNTPSDSLLKAKDAVLNYDENFIEFEFSALNFTNGIMNQFKYQLEGIDETIIHAGTRNFATYTDLAPGDYTFNVWSSNNHQIWNDQPTQFSFSISLPFWQTGYFYVLVGLFMCGLVLIYYTSRLNALKQQQKLKMEVAIEAQEKERNRLAAELHDDLGTKMSTLKLFLNSLDQQSELDENSKRINASAQELLDGSIAGLRNVLADLSPNVLFKRGLSAAIHDLVEQLNKSNELEVFFISSNPNQRSTESRELALYRVVQELVNNSLKHAQCTKIHIELEFKDRLISLRYEDNGIGIPHEIQDQGYGIRNIKQRIELHNGEAHWSTNTRNYSSGTTVTVQLPL